MKEISALILENKDILLCCITGIVSVAIAGFTYYQTKKLTFFNVYFENKVKAYNEFFDNLAKVPLHTSLEDGRQIISSIHKVSLYASEEASEYCLKLFEVFLNIKKMDENDSYDIVLGQAIEAFRKDIDNCKKFKFR